MQILKEQAERHEKERKFKEVKILNNKRKQLSVDLDNTHHRFRSKESADSDNTHLRKK